MVSILSFFFGSRRCTLDNRWVVEGETWRIQGTICIRDAYESLQVSTGMRGRKFGACFSWSHYFVPSWGSSLNPNASHRSHWSCSEVGVGLEAARWTLECTTQRRLRTLLHPSLSRRFWTNGRQLWCRWLQRDVFCYTLLAGTKFKWGKKYARLFFKMFGWLCEVSMAKRDLNNSGDDL